MPKANDPLDINGRLYKQIGRLLDDLEAQDAEERLTPPQRIAALIAIGRVQKMFVDLRKGEFALGGGSAIDRYSAAFAATDAARGGASGPGPAADFGELDREPEDDERDFDA